MKYILFLYMYLSSMLFAQDVIQTGRPGQSIGAGILANERYQLQSGLEYNSYEVRNSSEYNLINNNILRYGAGENWEVSGLLNINNINSSDISAENFQFGGRVNIISANKLNISFQSRLQLIDFDSKINDSIRTVNILVTVYSLDELGTLTNNLIFSNLNEDQKLFNNFTLSWSINLVERFNTFIEYYGSRGLDDEWVYYWDTGLGYLVYNDLMLDVSFGQDLDNDIDASFIAFGFSRRF